MKVLQLEEDKILKQCKKEWKNQSFELMYSDLYFEGTSSGIYEASWCDHAFYVHGEYAYEDVQIGNNKTRHKMQISCVLVKKDPYEIIYDFSDCYYGVYEENNRIVFEKYLELLPKLQSFLIQKKQEEYV